MARARTRSQQSIQLERREHHAALRERLRYVCLLYYNGNTQRMATALGLRSESLDAALYRDRVPQLSFLMRITRAKLVNAEWLLCGTGPVVGEGPEMPRLAEAPNFLQTAHDAFDFAEVQYRHGYAAAIPAAKRIANADLSAALPLARAIHASRVAHRPVILYLDVHAVRDGAGATAAEFLRKGYATGVAASAAAAQADLTQAVFGSNLDTAFVPELVELQRAAYLAAAHGMGYGEALGRWSYPVNDQRHNSCIATAYELKLPATIHVTLGEAEYHFFPAVGGAEFGAALGAASYADLRVFTEQVRQCGEAPGGVFIAVEHGTAGAQLLRNTQAALATRDTAPKFELTCGRLAPQPAAEQDNDYFIRGEPRLTLPALLIACDAVYDGSADDARSSKRTRNYRVKRDR